MVRKSLSYEGVSMMAKFMCQPDWVTKYAAIWSNIILCISVRVFVDEFNI